VTRSVKCVSVVGASAFAYTASTLASFFLATTAITLLVVDLLTWTALELSGVRTMQEYVTYKLCSVGLVSTISTIAFHLLFGLPVSLVSLMIIGGAFSAVSVVEDLLIRFISRYAELTHPFVDRVIYSPELPRGRLPAVVIEELRDSQEQMDASFAYEGPPTPFAVQTPYSCLPRTPAQQFHSPFKRPCPRSINREYKLYPPEIEVKEECVVVRFPQWDKVDNQYIQSLVEKLKDDYSDWPVHLHLGSLEKLTEEGLIHLRSLQASVSLSLKPSFPDQETLCTLIKAAALQELELIGVCFPLSGTLIEALRKVPKLIFKQPKDLSMETIQGLRNSFCDVTVEE